MLVKNKNLSIIDSMEFESYDRSPLNPDYLFESVYHVYKMFFKTIEFLFNIVRVVYNINYTIGFCIVQAIIGTYSFIINLGTNFYLLINVLVEDFHYFLIDISSLLQDLLVLLSGTYDFITEPITFNLDDKTKSFLYDTFSGKLLTDIMGVGKTILHKTKDGILSLGVFMWETTSLFFSVLQYLNKAPYLVILFICEALDVLLYSVRDLFYSLTFQMFVSFLINIGLILLAIRYKMHIYLINKGKRISNDTYQKLLPAFSRGSRNVLKYFTDTLSFSQNIITSTLINTYTSISIFLKGFGRRVISKTPTKAALKIQLEQEKLERLCIVCMDAQRNTMLLNCRHLVLCVRCAEHIVSETRECPVCRTFILDMINVYT